MLFRSEKIQTYCPNFISTSGSEPIEVRTPVHQGLYPVKPVDTVSTIGAGDNFNAGFIYGLLKYGVKRDDLACLGASGWAKLVACGQLFSANVCASVDNYIDVELGKSLRLDL